MAHHHQRLALASLRPYTCPYRSWGEQEKTWGQRWPDPFVSGKIGAPTPGSSACSLVVTTTVVRNSAALYSGAARGSRTRLARLIAVQDSTPASIPNKENRTWGPSTTINDAIEGWRENGWADLSPKTVRGYEEIWERYVRATIGTKRISALNAFEVERFFRKIKADGAGRDTVRRVRNVIGRACRLAAKWSGGLLVNPVADTELPTWPLAERPDPVRAPEATEVQALLRAAKDFDERFGAYLHVVAATGMRRGGHACCGGAISTGKPRPSGWRGRSWRQRAAR